MGIFMGNVAMYGQGSFIFMPCLSILMLLIFVCISEASKLVMSYVAAVCGKGQEVNKVKEQLLQSNPVLEGE